MEFEFIGGVIVGILKIVITIVYVMICVSLAVIVLMQEGDSDGLSGAIGGGSDTYWSKNKGRSKEGAVERATKYLAFLFIVLSMVLNLI